MRRRDFMTLAGSSLAWPFNALAQGPDTPVIGFLNSASRKPFAGLVAAFHKGLNEQRFWDGRNVKVEESWAEGDENRLMPLLRDLIQRRVKLIAATGGVRSAQTARDATSDIPVLFISGVNPVELGLVSSFNHPGRNLTGVNLDTTHLISKRLEMLYEFVPADTKVAVLASPGRFSPEAETKFYKEKKWSPSRSIPTGSWRTPSRQPSNRTPARCSSLPIRSISTGVIASPRSRRNIGSRRFIRGGNMQWPAVS